MKISENSSFIKVSKFISNFFNPFTSLVLYFIYFSFKNYTLQESLYRFLPIFLIIILPITLWIIYNVKIGKYQDMDVSNRLKRKTLYIFANACILIFLLYDYFIKDRFDLMMLFLFVLLILMQISNYFIKSSMHTSLNFFVSALFLSQNIWLGIFWVVISILVGISRVIVKRHTPKEVFMGFILSAFVSFAYLYTLIEI